MSDSGLLDVSVDAVSAATFHPSGSILATSSGQRKFDLVLNSSSDSSSDSDSNSAGMKSSKWATPKKSEGSGGTATSTIDNSIRLWGLPGDSVWYVDGQRWDGSDMAVDGTVETGGNGGGEQLEATTGEP